MCDPTGKIAYANQRWFDFTGMSPDDDETRWLSVLHPDDRRLCIQEADRAFRTNTVFNWKFATCSERILRLASSASAYHRRP